MKKFLALAAMLALMLTIAIPAVAQQNDKSDPEGTSVEQSQNAAIVQKGEGDGAENAASVEFGNQTAAQAQYDNPAEQDQYDETGEDTEE